MVASSLVVLLSSILCVLAVSAEASRPFGGGAKRATTFHATGSRRRYYANPGALTRIIRGGEQRELTLDEKVHAAMEKLGLQPPPPTDVAVDQEQQKEGDTDAGGAPNCDDEDGVCEIVPPSNESNTATVSADGNVDTAPQEPPPPPVTKPQEQDPQILADRIAQTMKVDSNMAWAALGATSTSDDNNDNDNKRRVYNEAAAREMIQLELEMIAQIPEDADEVQQLVSEGHDNVFLVRRALAFAERNQDDARAILLADQEDEDRAADEEEEERQQSSSSETFKTVTVDADFDPATIGTSSAAPAPAKEPTPPKPAAKESVVFEATGAQVQELVLESPVPVLLDIYADWCGPCKALSPILEDMAIKSGGAFRLVKLNSDNEKAVSSGALQVTALPTIFGIRDGKILHMFQGMPKSEEMLRNFMMGLLVPGQAFDPAVTDKEKQKYAELSNKLLKVAGSAAFPFSARERLQERVATRLDDLVQQTGDVYDTEQSAQTLRSLLSNVIRDPYAAKFRTVNLANKVIAAKVAQYPAAVALLKSVGFVVDSGDNIPNTMTLGKGKKIVNVAPLMVARDAIDKWINKTRYEVAKAARHRKDEEDRQRLEAEAKARAEAGEDDDDEEEEVDEVDPNECKLRLRLDGKNKVHDIVFHADDPLRIVLEKLPGTSTDGDDDDDVQITCVAKRLVVKSSDTESMNKSLRDHGLMPSAALVVKIASSSTVSTTNATTKLSERAAAAKKKKKGGSHTMQSVGIYGRDDGAKGELVDGGGGTLYEQDVTTDDEEEQEGELTDEKRDDDDASASESMKEQEED